MRVLLIKISLVLIASTFCADLFPAALAAEKKAKTAAGVTPGGGAAPASTSKHWDPKYSEIDRNTTELLENIARNNEAINEAKKVLKILHEKKDITSQELKELVIEAESIVRQSGLSINLDSFQMAEAELVPQIDVINPTPEEAKKISKKNAELREEVRPRFQKKLDTFNSAEKKEAIIFTLNNFIEAMQAQIKEHQSKISFENRKLKGLVAYKRMKREGFALPEAMENLKLQYNAKTINNKELTEYVQTHPYEFLGLSQNLSLEEIHNKVETLKDILSAIKYGEWNYYAITMAEQFTKEIDHAYKIIIEQFAPSKKE